MTTVFISHRHTDNAEAAALKEWLAAQGYVRLFLDFDPADGISGGADWERMIYRELRRSQAVVVLLTPDWLASRWCFAELTLAREQGKAVFVVKVKPTPNPVIPAVQEVDLTADRQGGLAKLAKGMKEHGLDPRDAFSWDPSRPIYPGLSAYEEEDAAVFFGRGEDSWRAVESLERLRRHGQEASRLLLVTGASGSGKSSLMRAGIIPRLNKDRGHWLTIRPFRRGADAIAELTEALCWAFVKHGNGPIDANALRARLRGAAYAEPPDGSCLRDFARDLRLAAGQPNATTLIALDQAEEFLAYGSGEAGDRLLRLLAAALADADRELMAVASIRSDALGAWQQSQAIRGVNGQPGMSFEVFPLGPMSLERIPEVIREPARFVGIAVEDDALDAMRLDVMSPDALPLLAFTLRRMHDRHAPNRRFTLRNYEEIGRLQGSIRNEADAAIRVEELSPDDRAALRAAFVPMMVRATEDGGFARERSLREAIPRRADALIERLVSARLLVTDRDSAGRDTVEVTHEALLRVWPTLSAWLSEDAEKLQLLAGLQRAAEEWARRGHRPDLISHRGERLGEANALLSESRFESRLGPREFDYLRACCAAQQLEDERRANEERQTHDLAVARSAVDLQRLGDAALRQFEAGGEQVTSLLAALRAARKLRDSFDATGPLDSYPTVSPIAALYGILDGIRELNMLNSAAPRVRWATISPDAEALAIVEGDEYSGGRNTARTFGRDGRELGKWELAKGNFRGIHFTPDSRRLLSVEPIFLSPRPPASGQSDGRWGLALQLWTLNGELAWVGAKALKLVMRPDLEVFAYIGMNGVAHLCDAAGNHQANLRLLDVPLTDLDISTDGSLVLAMAADSCLRLWTDADWTKPEWQTKVGDAPVKHLGFAGPDHTVFCVLEDGTVSIFDRAGKGLRRWSSDLRRQLIASHVEPIIAGIDEQRWVQIWNLDGQHVARFYAHDGRVIGLQVTPDGRRIATTGAEGVVQLRAIDGELMAELGRHAGRLPAMEMSRDGQRAITLDMLGKVRIWDTSRSLGPEFGEGGGHLLDIIPTHDGFLTADSRGTIRHWNISGRKIAQWELSRGPQEWFNLIRMSNDGRTVVSVSPRSRQTLRWRLLHGAAEQLGAFDVNSRDAAFSSDGQFVVVVADTSSVFLVHLGTGKSVSIRGINVFSARFDSAGTRVVIGGVDGVVRIYDSCGSMISEFPSGHGQVLEAIFAPSGRHVALACSDGTVLICDTEGKAPIECFGHSGRVLAARFSPDGQRLASGSTDGTVRVWDTAGRQLAKFSDFAEPLVREVSGGDRGSPGMCFSTDGKFLAFASKGTAVRMREIGNIDDLLERAQVRLGDYLASRPEESL
jgi:WD40 repeat protein